MVVTCGIGCVAFAVYVATLLLAGFIQPVRYQLFICCRNIPLLSIKLVVFICCCCLLQLLDVS